MVCESSWPLIYLSGHLCCSPSCSWLSLMTHVVTQNSTSHWIWRILEWYLWFGGIFDFLWSYSLQTPRIYQAQFKLIAGLVLETQLAQHHWAQSLRGAFWALWGLCSCQDLSSCPQLWSVGMGHLGQRKLNLDTRISSGKMLMEPDLGMRIKVAHLRETELPWSCHTKRGYPASSSARVWHSAGCLSQTAG